MKKFQENKRIIPIVTIGFVLLISVGSVYANTDSKGQLSLWAEPKIAQTINGLSRQHNLNVNSKQDTLINNINELRTKSLKELENSQTTIQKEVISDIQKELDSIESKLNASNKSKQNAASSDFDLAVEEVNGTTKATMQAVYEDPNLIKKENENQKHEILSFEDAHKLVEEEIEKTKVTIDQLKALAEKSKDSHVKNYILDKAAVLELMIKNVEK